MERGTRAQGDVFQDRYRIVRLLGRGGFGTTYEAIDEHARARVVLKEMRWRDAGDWKSVERFEREARVLAGLHHPNIPRYLDHGTLWGDEQGMFLVCELVDGPSLAQKVRSGWRPAEAELIALARQVLGALVYLHGRTPSIVHRDIKPANLIVRDDGAAALVDFGAVRDVWPSDASRASTIVVGTFGYIAPEQYGGEASARSDLFALGCTLVYAMTGLAPTELPQHRLRLMFRSSARVSRGLGRWLDRMIAPVAEDRFASAHDALRALDRLEARPAASRWAAATAMLALVVAGCIEGFMGSGGSKLVAPKATVWRADQGGNGHAYLVVTTGNKIAWADANAAAMNAHGHLATLTSPAESAFVFYLAASTPDAWIADSAGGVQGPWLGASRTSAGWTWITGEPWSYTNWARGEPTGSWRGVVEDKLQLRGQDGTQRPRPTWNDEGNAGFEDGPVSYVIEFESP